MLEQATIREIYRLVQEPNTRVSAPALHLSSEYLKLFTAEAIHRAAEVAQLEKDQLEEEQQGKGSKGKGKGKGVSSDPASSRLLETQHLEKIVAGMLLDF
ncbi:CENP-X/MHF2 family protein [Sporobolomyces salmoneus]|uniref:CENP-X/MHF2 family protein n=1 Tax=Sporobolomyces salmoneus TaxID=183962 RepID=UPI00317E538E